MRLPKLASRTAYTLAELLITISIIGILMAVALPRYGKIREQGQMASAMTPMQALLTATVHPAKFIGVDRDVGSLAVGKVADIVVLNSDPLANIRNTTDIRYVMKAGILYDGETLDQIWPQAKPFPKFFWFTEGIQSNQPNK